jgi:glucose-6-phosphate isomerase
VTIFTDSQQPVDYPDKKTCWQQLKQTAQKTHTKSLQDFFGADSNRAQSLRFHAAGLTADISRTHIDSNILQQLMELAEHANLNKKIQRLFAGENVNFTEDRPALHMALRGHYGPESLQNDVQKCRQRIHQISREIHTGRWLGYSQLPITDIVNIGIGGSDLGPRMVAAALSPYHHPQLKVHFVANIDPSDILQTLKPLNPATTLFIIVSKSWTTLETLANARIAHSWLTDAGAHGETLSKHFIAVSASPERCQAFGIPVENILPMWDWVGGRFSLWSAVGLSIALATSAEIFEQLLAGANAMDQHFASAPLPQNLPVLVALLEIWYVNFWDCSSTVILPYHHHLRYFPNFLQQLAMESNGKQVDTHGNTLQYHTGPIVWGAAGTNGQHSFHQLLHQGTRMIPVDFIVPLSGHTQQTEQHRQLVANCLAQAEVLMEGQSKESIERTLLERGLEPTKARLLAQHKAIAGNKPSTIISMAKLTPSTLGALIALYEHKIFSASVIWDINAFDQWGVELGKVVSSQIYNALGGGQTTLSNPATVAAIGEYTLLNNDS